MCVIEMAYWVEYSNMKGIRENLMTDSIVEARRRALMVCIGMRDRSRAYARIFSGKDVEYFVGDIFSTVYRNHKMWLWQEGLGHFPRVLDESGRLHDRVYDLVRELTDRP